MNKYNYCFKCIAYGNTLKKGGITMLFQVDPRNHIPIWEQIVNQVKELVLKGILAPEDKIPSVRELASSLIVNPNTVSKAYQELERQGIIETLRGRGTFVRATLKTTADEEKVALLQDKTKQLIIEGSYLGVTSDMIIEWVRNFEKELGGSKE